MKKTSFFLLLFTFLHFFSDAQKFDVKFSDAIEAKSVMLKKGSFVKYLPDQDGGILALYHRTYKKVKAFSFGTYDGLTSAYNIIKVNKNLKIDSELDLENVPNKNAYFVDFIKLQSKYYLIYQEFDKPGNSLNIYAHELNTDMLTVATGQKIATFDVSNDENRNTGFLNKVTPFTSKLFDVNMSYSRDSVVLCFSYFSMGKLKENKSIQFVTMDKNLTKIATRTYDFGIPEKKMEVIGFNVDIAGKVYISYDEYDKTDTKSFKRENGEKVPAYTTHLLILENQKEHNILLNNNSKFLKKINIGYDANDDILIFGLYKNVYQGNYLGICVADLNQITSAKKSLEFKYNEFPQEILDKVTEDNFGEKKGEEKGISTFFRFHDIITVSDGYLHLILEYVSPSLNYGDIIIATFLPNDNINYTCIPKNQGNPYNTFFYSFQAIYKDDTLLLLYNDIDENIKLPITSKPRFMTENGKTTSFVCTSLTHEGTFIKREAIYSHKSIDGCLTNSTFYMVAPDTYAINCAKSRTFSQGSLEVRFGLLTIK